MKAYKVLGGRMDQHFLINYPTIEQIVIEAELKPEDIVLEIGGGLGNLSEKIAPLVKKLYIVEKDERLVEVLKDRLLRERNEEKNINVDEGQNELELSDIFYSFGFKNVEIIEGDVTQIDLSEIPFNKIVANLPYSISSEITIELLKHDFDTAVLMYQYEFAKRLDAEPNSKDYGRLSVLTQYKADTEILFKVPASYFRPEPKVDSAVIKITPKIKNDIEVRDEEYFFEVTKAIFSQRRKKVRNNLIRNQSILKNPDLKYYLDNLCIEIEEEANVLKLIEKRAENLSIEEIGELSNFLYDLLGKEVKLV